MTREDCYGLVLSVGPLHWSGLVQGAIYWSSGLYGGLCCSGGIVASRLKKGSVGLWYLAWSDQIQFWVDVVLWFWWSSLVRLGDKAGLEWSGPLCLW